MWAFKSSQLSRLVLCENHFNVRKKADVRMLLRGESIRHEESSNIFLSDSFKLER